jgi:hypothetical protein
MRPRWGAAAGERIEEKGDSGAGVSRGGPVSIAIPIPIAISMRERGWCTGLFV